MISCIPPASSKKRSAIRTSCVGRRRRLFSDAQVLRRLIRALGEDCIRRGSISPRLSIREPWLHCRAQSRDGSRQLDRPPGRFAIPDGNTAGGSWHHRKRRVAFRGREGAPPGIPSGMAKRPGGRSELSRAVGDCAAMEPRLSDPESRGEMDPRRMQSSARGARIRRRSTCASEKRRSAVFPRRRSDRRTLLRRSGRMKLIIHAPFGRKSIAPSDWPCASVSAPASISKTAGRRHGRRNPALAGTAAQLSVG